MKQVIRLTENDLHRIVENSVNRILAENVEDEGKFKDNLKKAGMGLAVGAATLGGMKHCNDLDSDLPYSKYDEDRAAEERYYEANPDQPHDSIDLQDVYEGKKRSTVRLSESQLQQIVENSIKRVLNKIL